MNKIWRLLDVTPKVKILTLGADSQGQNFDHRIGLPGSRFPPWEPTPKVKILTLGADSQGLGSQLVVGSL